MLRDLQKNGGHRAARTINGRGTGASEHVLDNFLKGRHNPAHLTQMQNFTPNHTYTTALASEKRGAGGEFTACAWLAYLKARVNGRVSAPVRPIGAA
jgi:hypothetical protein